MMQTKATAMNVTIATTSTTTLGNGNGSATDLATLADDLLIEISSYLTFHDILSLCRICRATVALAHNEQLWQLLWNYYFCIKIEAPESNNNSYERLFRDWYQRFPGPYLYAFRRVSLCYKRYVKYLAQHQPFILSTFNDGIDLETLRTFEQFLPLPVDYSLWLQFNNGQSVENNILTERLPDGLAQQLDATDIGNADLFAIGSAVRDKNPYITISQASRAGILGGFAFYNNHYNIYLEPISQDTIEYIRETIRDGPLPIFSSGTEHEFRPIYYLHQDGHVSKRLGMYSETSYSAASSFIELMEEHIDRLEQNILTISPKGGISRFAVADPCGSVCVTRGIRVSVSVLWIPELFQDGYHVFAYQIRLEHTAEVDVKASLLSRRWRIRSEEGEKEVEGPGVIGLYPHIYPNCPVFDYSSCCPIRGTSGSMYGSFQFMDDETLSIFDVEVGEFSFDIHRNFI